MESSLFLIATPLAAPALAPLRSVTTARPPLVMATTPAPVPPVTAPDTEIRMSCRFSLMTSIPFVPPETVPADTSILSPRDPLRARMPDPRTPATAPVAATSTGPDPARCAWMPCSRPRAPAALIARPKVAGPP